MRARRCHSLAVLRFLAECHPRRRVPPTSRSKTMSVFADNMSVEPDGLPSGIGIGVALAAVSARPAERCRRKIPQLGTGLANRAKHRHWSSLPPGGLPDCNILADDDSSSIQPDKVCRAPSSMRELPRLKTAYPTRSESEFAGGPSNTRPLLPICYLGIRTATIIEVLLAKCGDPGGYRTHGPVIKSHMLYH